MEAVLSVVETSVKEAKIEHTLRRLRGTWSEISFQEKTHLDVNGESIVLLCMSPDDDSTLENDRMIIRSTLASRFHKHFAEELHRWRKTLDALRDISNRLSRVTYLWKYLEPLFGGSEEVKRELPIDQSRFASVDRDLRSVLQRARSVRIVRKVSMEADIANNLKQFEDNLGLCKQNLSHFLDEKRKVFSNFYFVAEQDMLDVLARGGKNPASVLKYIPVLFPQWKSLDLKEETIVDTKRFRAERWYASVGLESVAFDPPVILSGKTEQYLSELLRNSRDAIKSSVQRSMRRYRKLKFTQWIVDLDKSREHFMDSTQTTSLVCSAEMTRLIEKAFKDFHLGDRTAVASLVKTRTNTINDCVTLLLRSGKRFLKPSARARVSSTIVRECAYRDILKRFVKESVTEPYSFRWRYFMKVRWNDAESVRIDIGDRVHEYGYDYFGNGDRAVLTSQTERAMVSCVTCLGNYSSICLKGSAGIGKSETVRELSKMLGRQCYTIQCSKNHDFRGIAMIFRCIAASGSWACLDFVSHLLPDVLAIVSSHMNTLSMALRAEKEEIVLDAVEVPLVNTCALFATMSREEAAKKACLSDTLRANMRTIEMIRPDIRTILEVTLQSLGFAESEVLSKKLHSMYTALHSTTSKTEWSQIGTMIHLLRNAEKDLRIWTSDGVREANDQGLPMSESELLLRVLRETYTPSLLSLDSVVFESICQDTFPKLKSEIRQNETFGKKIAKASMDRHRWPDKNILQKMMQLDETLAERSFVLLLGDAASGKSECWKTIARARKLKHENVKVLHPDIHDSTRFIGSLDIMTRDWTDGLFASILREVSTSSLDLLPKDSKDDKNDDESAKIPSCGSHWIVLDGEPRGNNGWMDSMYSLLENPCCVEEDKDTTRALHLVSHERLRMEKHVRIIVETTSISSASPSAIGRAAIVRVGTNEESEDAPMWLNIVAAWVCFFFF